MKQTDRGHKQQQNPPIESRSDEAWEASPEERGQQGPCSLVGREKGVSLLPQTMGSGALSSPTKGCDS